MSGENPELRSTLSEVLASVHLQGYLEAALKFCEKEGAWEVGELVPEEVFSDLVQEIGLKKLEVKRLKVEFEKRWPSQAVDLEKTSSSASYQDSPQPGIPVYFPGYPGACIPGAPGFTVKNTFIEPALSHPLPNMTASRAQTWAYGNPGRVQEIGGDHENRVDENDEEDEEDEDQVDGPGNHSSPSTSTRRPAELGEKTTTYDSFEHQPNKWEDTCVHPSSSSQAGHLDPSALDPSAVLPFPPMMMGLPMMPMMHGMPMSMMDPSLFMAQQQGWESLHMPAPADPKPRAPLLERVYSVSSQCERIRWTFDARKLKSTDREAVSQPFNVSCSGGAADCQFKMVLKPKAVDTSRGGACFKKSRGKGYIILRCTSELEAALKPTLTFRMCIKSNRREEGFRGPVRNNFAERAMCGLPEGQDEWDFNKVVDKETNTFVVVLELLKDDS